MARKCMTEGALDKCLVAVRLELETKYKLISKYGEEGMPFSTVLYQALNDAVKNVKLSKKELDAVNAEIAENYKKRMDKRDERGGRVDHRCIVDYTQFKDVEDERKSSRKEKVVEKSHKPH